MGDPQHELCLAVESLTGRAVERASVVRGGDFAAAYRIDLDDGTTLFAKTHPDPPPGFFTTEASGLAWLRSAGAVAVPEVLVASDGSADGPAMLVMEWIDELHRRPASDAELGRSLAAMHDAGAPCFGRADRRTTGSRALPNEPSTTWSTFYASNRLLPLARLATDARALAATTIVRLERLAHSLDAFDDGQPPARLHGDLWAGNRIVDGTGRSWLVDPAAHGGHREFDLAMMRLFGGFAPDCFAAYQEVHRLLPGWQDRVQLHQIAPLVVHAIKFGRSYVDAATAAIMRY
ncbi:MAG: putative ribulosamine/erythrulosamine 3-kinase [Ilumatobacteraceae bacterium]|nr:putative ribulosamine/erythrulosamine 3-kinase [Ilumatobacteraceae bacterium]